MIEFDESEVTYEEHYEIRLSGLPFLPAETAKFVEKSFVLLAAAGCAIKSAFTTLETNLGDKVEEALTKLRSRS